MEPPAHTLPAAGPAADPGSGGGPDGRDSRVRLLVPPAVVAAGGLGSLALLGWVDHAGLSVLPACPFLSLTGLWCPLCGGTRAMQALSGGDVVAALGLNLLVVLAVPVVLAEWVRWTAGRARGRPTSFMNVSSRTLGVVAGLALLYMVVRNVPGLELLAPAG
jgi:hypothetical protein